MRDGASATYLKYLKSRIVGENPCEVDRIFRKNQTVRRSGKAGGRVCAIELAPLGSGRQGVWRACVPASGRKVPDKVRLYADTHIEEGRATGILMEPEKVGRILKGIWTRDLPWSKYSAWSSDGPGRKLLRSLWTG